MEWANHGISVFVNLLWIVMTILLCSIIFLWWLSYQHKSKLIGKLPGIQVFSLQAYFMILGYVRAKCQHNAVVYIQQMVSFLCAASGEHGITKVWLGLRPIVMLFKQDTVEAVLNNSSLMEKSHEYKFLHLWLNTGLLTSKGNKWRSRRKLLTPSFHFRILEEYIPIFNEQSQILVDKMKPLTDMDWVDIVPLITACTLEMVCETTMGVSLNAQRNANTDYVNALYEVGDAFIYRSLRPWLWIDWIYYILPSGRRQKKTVHILHEFTMKVIKEKKAILMQHLKDDAGKKTETKKEDLVRVKKRRAFLEILLEHQLQTNELTEKDIREEVDTFMFEGHDTTTMAICWTLYNIGLRPDIQEKVLKELDNIFYSDVNRPVTFDELKEMMYLECIIKEALRLYPSVPFIGREVKKDISILNYTIPAGSSCMIIPYELHRNPQVFPNPEYFDPDRFSPENAAGRHPYAYVPFSAGPRNCIGQKFAMMEEKIILAHILRNFEVQSLDQRDQVSVVPLLILRNEYPLRLKFIPRKR